MNHNFNFAVKKIIITLSFVLMFVIPYSVVAVEQFDTTYFTIIYDESGEYTAGEIAKFCDEVYEKLMARYNSFTDDPRVLCIVNDAVDLSTGYAVYFQNTITIYATNMDFELRGQTSWLKNVFVHEMTHMIALKKAAKGPVNFISLGGGKYNDNPDVNVDIVLYHLSQPGWFYEGSAQLGAESFGSEHWDTHRDMLLRSAWTENSLLTLDEMSSLPGKKAIDAEMVYNQGYSMVEYIREKYGYDKVVELNNTCGYFDFDPTIKRVLGVDTKQLYDDWRLYLDNRYASFRDRSFVEGEKVEDNGTADYYPVLSPDGRYLAWLSNRGRDYAITDIMLKDMTTGDTDVIVKNVDYRISWSHDSTKLLYVKRPKRSPLFYDIYSYDVTTKKERRISKKMRARDPNFSPGDSLIVFVRNASGNNSLAVINTDGTGLRYLTSAHDGTQFYSPSFSPDGSKILFGVFRQNLDRDIGYIDAETVTYRYNWEYADSTSGFADSTLFGANCDFTLLLGSKADERDPRFLPDGSGIVYVSDKTGVFNIYKLDFKTSRTRRLTDLYGGAFSPSVGNDGDIYYAGYKADDFSIYRTSSETVVEDIASVVLERDYIKQPKPFDLSEHFNVQPYKRKRIVNAIVPTLRIGPSFIGSKFGLNVIDVGARLYVSDLLGYDSLILGGSVGKNFKEDVALNNYFDLYYERAMVPVTSSKYTHAPRFYAGASRIVINNYINRLEAVADSVFYDNIPELGYENVLHDMHQKIMIDDEYRDEFRVYQLGVYIPLANRHSLSIDVGLRQYYESMKRHYELRDFSSLFHDDSDITGEVPDARKTSSTATRFFTNMNYFRSREFGASYFYSRSVPAADNDIAPKGTALLLRFRHLRTAIADSLIDQPLYYAPLGINIDGSIAVGQYNPDPFKDELRPFKENIDLNEYILLFQENHQLPYLRHVINGRILVAYKDISLKDVMKDEGSGYNWPLKYYLGGANMLCGYPYFAFWGSKIFYSRIGYTFPIKPNIAKNIMGLHFQRLYGNAFFEAGRTWNFRNLSMDKLNEGSFKRDVGFELRCSMVAFYRFPTIAYVRVAWPLDDMSGSRYTNDARRFYFGLRM